ncbi:MAG: carbon storage regulator [Planctomycetota bacterium]
MLSRKKGESVVLPDLGVEITIQKLSGSRAVVAIQAPANIEVHRGEVVQKRVSQPDDAAMMVIEAEIEAIADMADQHFEGAARQAAQHSLQKLRQLRRLQEEKVETESSRETSETLAELSTTENPLVREPSVGYAVVV